MPTVHPLDRGWAPVGVVIGLLAVSNVMTNRVLPDAAYVPWNLMMSAAVLAVAVRVDAIGAAELGLDRRWLRRGVLVGAAVLVSFLAIYAIGLSWPATRDLFDDDRVAGTSTIGMWYQVIVRIPLGTVVLEEVAFRGVLLGMLLARTTRIRAIAGSAVAFGLWHVLPAIGIEDTNPVLGDWFGGAVGSLVVVVAAVVGSALAGLLFTVYRLVGRHLAAPIIGHVASNSLGFAVAWWYTGSS